MKTSPALAALLTFLTFSGLATAAMPPTQATNLFGMTAVDARNKRMGVITDFVADLEKGTITGVQVGHATADGMAHEIYPIQGVQFSSDKVTVRTGSIGQEAMDTQSVAKAIHAPLKDGEGKPAGEISDVMVSIDEAKVTAFLLKFDPKWLDMQGEAAVGLSTVERKEDGFVAKFTAQDVRPATPNSKPIAAPPPPQPVPRARLSQLPGSPIVDVSGKQIGTVDDVLITVGTKKLSALVVRPDGGNPTAIGFPQPNLKFVNGKLTATSAVDALMKAPGMTGANTSKVLSTKVVNPSNEPSGKVEDVIVDMGDGSLQFVVASFDPSWVAQGWFVVLPIKTVSVSAAGDPVVRFSLAQVNSAFIFEAKGTWPNFSDPGMNAGLHAKLDGI